MLKYIFILIIAIFILTSCTSSKPNISVNENFNLQKYLGKWYEIKRFDHSFERGITKAEANYEQISENKISVVNKGMKPNNEESVFRATAKQINKNFLKVYPNAFPIFGAEYNVLWVSENYEYAIVCSSSFKYLWFLSRTPEIPKNILDEMIKISTEKGFDTSKLINGQ